MIAYPHGVNLSRPLCWTSYAALRPVPANATHPRLQHNVSCQALRGEDRYAVYVASHSTPDTDSYDEDDIALLTPKPDDLIEDSTSRNHQPPTNQGQDHARAYLWSAEPPLDQSDAGSEDDSVTSMLEGLVCDLQSSRLPGFHVPLPLASVKHVQQLLGAMEVPDYCLRLFKDNGLNGQDLMTMSYEDLQDQRFRLPEVTIRKIMRAPNAWRLMCVLNRSDVNCHLSLCSFVTALHHYGLKSPESQGRLMTVFRACDSDKDNYMDLVDFARGCVFITDIIQQELERLTLTSSSNGSNGSSRRNGNKASNGASSSKSLAAMAELMQAIAVMRHKSTPRAAAVSTNGSKSSSSC